MTPYSSKYFVIRLLLVHLVKYELCGRGLAVASSSETKQHEFDNDFEDGSIAPWIDQSERGTGWVLNEMESVLLTNGAIQPPPPPSGKRFLWLKHDFMIFDIGILSTGNFVAFPGDKFQFSYWISSQYSYFNNIQLFWCALGQDKDERMIELFSDSTIHNSEWRISTAQIPISNPMVGQIIIYGFRTPETSEILLAINDFVFIHDPTLTSSSAYASSTALSTDNPTTELLKSSEFTSKLTTLPTFATSLETECTSMTNFESTPASMAVTSPTTVADNKCNGGQIPDDVDFSPCTACILDGTGELEVRCELVNMTDVRDGPFQRLANLNIDFLYLTMIDGDAIPVNFLGSAVDKIKSFFIDCTNNEIPLVVSQSAFGNDSVVELINNFYTTNCDLSNLAFLSGIKHLDELKFENSSNLHQVLATIPSDFLTNTFGIEKCKNLNAVDTEEKLPLSLISIQQFMLTDNEDLKEETVDLFLNWLIDSSLNTLETLHLYNNGLAKIPADILKFTFLSKFRFDNSPIQNGVVLKGSLDFLFFSYELDLSSCGIDTIQPGTFVAANYQFSVVSLASNNLTRLDYDVFYVLLKKMSQGTSGRVSIFENSIDCQNDPCHLTWLIQDNRNLFNNLRDGQCEDGRKLNSISPNDEVFNSCP